MNLLKLAASATLAAAMIPAAASAQTAAAAAPTLTAGTTVYDPQGGEVGKIDSSAGGNVVIDTGTNKATIPATAITKGTKGPQIAYTKAQLDQAIEAAAGKQQAALQQALTVGAAVAGKEGSPVGTVHEVQDAQVVIQRPDQALVALPKTAFMVNASGGLQISMTAAQLEAQIGAGTPAPAPAATASTNAATGTTPPPAAPGGTGQ